MHELAIADVRGRDRRAPRRRAAVAKVELKVGHLRQVVPSRAGFAFELVAEGTELEGAELVIEEVPAAGRCRAAAPRPRCAAFPLRCARCGGLDVRCSAGEELLVDALELEEEALITNGGMSHGD